MIVKRTSVACRCNRKVCQHRRRLPKHPDEYRPKVPPVRKEGEEEKPDPIPKELVCGQCGKGQYRPDPYRNAGKEWRKPCNCGMYSFPHARGRGYCTHNPNLTPEMMQEREESGVWA